MWMVVSAIWPKSDVVIGLADTMSKHWGVQFPKTQPWFPPNIPESVILKNWHGYDLGFAQDNNNNDNKSGKDSKSENKAKKAEQVGKGKTRNSKDKSNNEQDKEPHGTEEESGDVEDKDSDDKEDTEDESSDTACEKVRKRRAAILKEASMTSQPQKQKTSNQDITIVSSDNENDTDIETLGPEEPKSRLAETKRSLLSSDAKLRQEAKRKETEN